MDIVWLTIDQASAEAGVSRRTIYKWLEQKRLNAVRTAGGNIRIEKHSLFRKLDGSLNEDSSAEKK